MSNDISPATVNKNKAQASQFLMCAPDYFEVTYEINQWMEPDTWKSDAPRLTQNVKNEWKALYDTFKSIGVSIQLVPPQPGVPDMVFTANAAIVLNGHALLSRFRYKERQAEEKFFAQSLNLLKENGLIQAVDEMPAGIIQEGAGDCLWDGTRQMFWAGYGPRSNKESISCIRDYFNKEVVDLELLSSRFYHLDLSMSPLSFGQVLYYPEAFSPQSQQAIKEHVPADQLIAIDKEDAFNFVCNLVNIDNQIVMSRCSKRLKSELQERGYSIIETPVNTFGLAGGAVCCLTLKLNLQSITK